MSEPLLRKASAVTSVLHTLGLAWTPETLKNDDARGAAGRLVRKAIVEAETI